MTATYDGFQDLRATLEESMIERHDEIDAMLLGLVAQEHVLLIGPPGTGKSLLATNLTRAIDGARVFQILLTKFTTPEEFFGPVKLSALKLDRYERELAGYAATADILFVDEIWKASSAILNTQLTLLQERAFDNGGTRVQCPLKLAIAASNEWPSSEEGQELGAVFDRFLIRRVVKPVSPANRNALLYAALPDVTPQITCRNHHNDISDASKSASALPVSDEAKAAFSDILDSLTGAGIRPGDRRQRKAIKIARAKAWLSRDVEVKPIHLECLADVLWSSPEHIDRTAEIVTKIANPVGAAMTALMAEVTEIEGTLTGDVVDDPAKRMVAIQKLEELGKRAAKLAGEGGNGRAKQIAAHVRGARIKLVARSMGMDPAKAERFLALQEELA